MFVWLCDTYKSPGMALDNDDDNNSDTPTERDMPLGTVRQASLTEGGDGAESAGEALAHEASGGQPEDSDPELDLLAETESDSDDNHSNQDAASAQRSVQTGATAGSDTGKNETISGVTKTSKMRGVSQILSAKN